MISVSIIICTRSRAASLKETLRSIGAVCFPADWRVEVIVVDNGSTDETGAVVAGARSESVRFRYFQEPRPGQCYARNTGLAHADGSIILFTDDDVRVPADWVVRMSQPILAGHADAVAGGITVPPDLAHALSKQPYCQCRSIFAVSDYLDPLAPQHMIGANMAFHRRVLEVVPRFDTELGPGALGFSDEVLFSHQLKAAGFRLIGSLDVVVCHHFDRNRMNREALLGTFEKMGRSQAFVYHHWRHGKSRLLLPRLVWARIRRWGYALADRLFGTGLPSMGRLHLEQRLAFAGELRRQRVRPPKYPRNGPGAIRNGQ